MFSQIFLCNFVFCQHFLGNYQLLSEIFLGCQLQRHSPPWHLPFSLSQGRLSKNLVYLLTHSSCPRSFPPILGELKYLRLCSYCRTVLSQRLTFSNTLHPCSFFCHCFSATDRGNQRNSGSETSISRGETLDEGTKDPFLVWTDHRSINLNTLKPPKYFTHTRSGGHYSSSKSTSCYPIELVQRTLNHMHSPSGSQTVFSCLGPWLYQDSSASTVFCWGSSSEDMVK